MTAEQIKELRSKLGISQDKLAAMLNVAPYTVRRWESGKVTPSPLAEDKLKNIFKKSQKGIDKH